VIKIWLAERLQIELSNITTTLDNLCHSQISLSFLGRWIVDVLLDLIVGYLWLINYEYDSHRIPATCEKRQIASRDGFQSPHKNAH
jgi:hypothetical protein